MVHSSLSDKLAALSPEELVVLRSHNKELSYTKKPPKRIFFFCEEPPRSQGETPIVDCRKVYQKLPLAMRNKFENKQVCYVKNMHGSQGFGKSWQEHFETSSLGEILRHYPV